VTAIKLSTAIDKVTFTEIVNATTYRPHSLTGVDQLHRSGIRGKGTVIGVVDTGLDYTHPDIGGGIGPDKTVLGGTDLVGDNCRLSKYGHAHR
jgi:subtilisin family serine protease